MSKIIFAAAAGAFVAVANAQAAPDWKLIPSACAQQCAQTVETSFLCHEQYTIGTLVYSCFCNAYPSDAAGCTTCLESNNAAALAGLLKGTTEDCKTQEKNCAFACAFETCPSNDVNCQCDGGYLSNIFNCASCNTANNNAGSTDLSNFKSLNESCGMQNFTGAAQEFHTFVQSPTGQDAYVAPTLTATGGGEAATGTFNAPTDKPAATAGAPTVSGAAAGSASASQSGAAAATPTTAPSVTSTPLGTASHSASGTAASGAKNTTAPSTTPKSGSPATIALPGAVAVGAALFAALL